MTGNWDIMYGTTKIGTIFFELSDYGVLHHNITTGNFPLDKDALWKILLFRTIPSDRVNCWLIDMLMQYPNGESDGRKYGFYFVLAIFSYCRSLTDPFWINPSERYVFSLAHQGQSSLSTEIMAPTTYDKSNFFDNGFSDDVGKIILANPYKYTHYTNIDYNSPDLTIRTVNDLSWQQEKNEYWLYKQLPYLEQDEIKKICEEKQRIYEEAKVYNILAPNRIRSCRYGWKTPNICQKGDILFENNLIRAVMNEKDLDKAKEKFASRFGLKIVSLKSDIPLRGIVIRGNKIYDALW